MFVNKLSKDQAEALSAIGQWLKAGNTQHISLGGYAGTGKTTLLAALRHVLKQNRPEMSVAFGAYTGKAAQVLRTKLQSEKILQPADSCSTLHGLMYYSQSKGGKDAAPSWRKRESLKYDLLVVDEASMVSEEIWNDLLSFGKPVLAVGDHGQLPPINSNFNLMEQPDLRLEKIWRQAADSPIIQLATMARTTGQIPVGNYGAGVRKLSRNLPETGDEIEQILTGPADERLVLCGYNHTRQKLNAHMRELREFESPEPARSDVVVCLRNSRESGLYNGQLGQIEAIIPADNDPENIWWYVVANFEGNRFEGYVPREQFSAPSTLARLPRRPKTDMVGVFDFGYALTVHKAQGSQAPKVLVFEERFAKMDDAEWRRWLYTAITRAERELTIVGY
jgi:exodeoxyribonuclease-5